MKLNVRHEAPVLGGAKKTPVLTCEPHQWSEAMPN